MLKIFPTLLWALRDMRGSWRYFRLVLVCLILSLASITAIQIAGSSVLKSIDSQANVILGGDWVLRQLYAPVGEAERKWLQSKGADTADTIEMRVMLINPETQDATLVELKSASPQYPLYGRVEIEPKGDFHQNLQSGLIMERSLGERLNVGIGDVVQLGEARFKVAAWIAKEPDRAGGGRFGLAPRVFISSDRLRETGLQQPGSMVYYDLRVKLPPAINAQKLKMELLSTFKQSSWRLTDKEKASPQIQRYVDNIVQFMTLIGLCALLTGGIGIANGMRAYFQSRLVTIAIYKSIGMTKNDIRKVFIWQIALICLIGTLSGITAGLVIPVLAGPSLQSLLPFPVFITISPFSVIVPLLFGIITSFIFSLWPFGEAEKISPLVLLRNMVLPDATRPAWDVIAVIFFLVVALGLTIIFTSDNRLFSAFFIFGAVLCFSIFSGLGLIISRICLMYAGKASFVTRTALQNLGRKGNSTAQTLVSLGIGLTVLISVALIERNIGATLKDNLPQDAPSFFFLDIQPGQKEGFEKTVSAVPSASHVIIMPNLRGRIVSVNGVNAREALVDQRESWLLSNERGFTYTENLPAHSEIIEGDWWPKGYAGPPIISIVDDVQRAFGVKVGDKMTFSILGREIKATIANIREVNWTNFTVNFAITFAPGALEGAPHSWLATVVARPDKEVFIQREVTKNFPNISMIRLSETIATVNALLEQMNDAIRVMALLSLTTGLIVLAQSMIATRQRRSYDTTILKVIGVPAGWLNRMLLIEFALLGSIAAICSAFIATGISWAVLALWMDLQWNFYPALILQTVVISIAAITIISWLILRDLLKTQPARYLRNE